ncbi:MAG: sugar phosphate nucleotidyltransferase, partial [Nitrososphaerota archaeon]
ITKEMLPLFDKREGLSFKPLIQIVFERLYDAGIREFCIITGRGKRAIEDYFSRDDKYLEFLRSIGKLGLAEKLKSLYEILDKTKLSWIYQTTPAGLGAAVLLAEPFTKSEPFIVHAGDTYIASSNYLNRMLKFYEEATPEILFLTARVCDPSSYGILEEYSLEDENIYRVYKVVEKPEKPKTNLAIVPVYIFTPNLFEILKKVEAGVNGEIQLTDAIQMMVKSHRVYAMELDCNDYIDIGKPENYLDALEKSFRPIG